MMKLIYVYALISLPLLASSQEEAFYFELKNETIVEVFTKIEDTYGVIFSYQDDDISNKRCH